MIRFRQCRTMPLCCCAAALLGLAIVDLTASLRAADNDKAAPTAPAGTSADQATDQKLIDVAKTNSELMTNLAYISDMIGARLTGSKALQRANEYTAHKMQEYGLVNVHLEPWTIPVGWERGDVTARMVQPDNGVRLSMASMAWTPGTKGKVVGDVVILKANTAKDLEKYKGKLKNAIVLARPPSFIAPLT